MPKAVLLVYTNCPEGKEQEFNRWYDTIHVPDILAIDGFSAAQRFRLAGPGPNVQAAQGAEPAVAQYLAMYEMESDDTRPAMKRLNEAVGGLAQRGRMFDGMQLVSAATYTAVADRQEA